MALAGSGGALPKAWRCWRPAATWRSGPRTTCSRWTATHYSTSSGRSTTRSAPGTRRTSRGGRGPGGLPDSRAEIEASGLFGDVVTRQFGWEVSYSAAEYIQLLDTFSSHIDMAPWQRDRLYGEIRRRLAARPDGRLRRGWGAVLHVARRRDRAGPG